MLPIAKELQLDVHDSYIISYNGGKTIKVATEEVEVSQSVSKKNFDLIVDFCREHNFLILTYQDGHIIHDGDHEYRDIESELTGLPMKRVNDIKAYINDSVPKAMGVDYAQILLKYVMICMEVFNSEIDVTTSKPFFLEFMARMFQKVMRLKHYVKN